MNWLSFDWDVVTGDCREDFNECVVCSYACEEVVPHLVGSNKDGSVRGYAPDEPNFDEALSLAVRLLSHPWERVVIRECHCDIVAVLRPGDAVLNVDHHEDNDSVHSSLHCGNWVTWTQERMSKIRFAGGVRHLDSGRINGYMEEEKPTGLFVCWSVPFTPEGTDYEFWELMGVTGQHKLTTFDFRQEAYLRKATGTTYRRPGEKYLKRIFPNDEGMQARACR